MVVVGKERQAEPPALLGLPLRKRGDAVEVLRRHPLDAILDGVAVDAGAVPARLGSRLIGGDLIGVQDAEAQIAESDDLGQFSSAQASQLLNSASSWVSLRKVTGTC